MDKELKKLAIGYATKEISEGDLFVLFGDDENMVKIVIELSESDEVKAAIPIDLSNEPNMFG